MLNVLATLALAIAPVQPMRPDTPPALPNRDQVVTVWIQLPIVYKSQ